MNSNDVLAQLPATLLNYAAGVVVLILIINRQLRKKPLNQKTVVWIVLLVIGLVETMDFVQQTPVKVIDVAITVLSILIGGALAIARAYTIRLWVEGYGEDRTVWQQGNWLTALLWIAGIGQHLLLDAIAAPGLASTSLLLYFGLVMFVQRRIVVTRARAQQLIA